MPHTFSARMSLCTKFIIFIGAIISAFYLFMLYRTAVFDEKMIDLPLDLAFSVVNKLRGQVQGKITQQGKASNLELSLHISPFPPV